MKRIHHCTYLTGILLFFFIFSPAVHAQDGQTYIVDASNLSVRTAPSEQGEIIGFLNNGDQLTVFQKKYGWLQTYYDGQEAWVAQQFLYPADNQTARQNQSNKAAEVKQESLTVTASSVRLRKGPGTNYIITGYTSVGDSYTVLQSRSNWYKVSLDNGGTGWIAGWLTNKSSTPSHSNSRPSSKNGSLSGYTIAIDPGHGGMDPGSIAINGSYEKLLTETSAAYLAQALKAEGAQVIVTRPNDTFVSLQGRVNISQTNHADAFISLHYDAFPTMGVSGVSTHFYNDPKSRMLANAIQTSLGENVPLRSRGIMNSNYHVLRENSGLAVLVELGFITNPHDFNVIQTDRYQQQAATGIAEGLLDYFN